MILPRQRSKRRVIIPLVVLIALGVASVAVVMNLDHIKASTSASSTSNLPQKTPGKSQFSFDTTAASDWRQGPADKVSLAAFYSPSDCFISVEHKAGTLNVATELQKDQNGLSSDGYTSKPGAVVSATLQTSTGKKQFELHQYTVSGNGSGGKLYIAHEFGYIQLTDGYVKAQGYCDATKNMLATVTALQAIKFDAAS
ncbi:MAG: hypothetical protein H6797_01315 [Candidatus Nomurabacteria bacterium]|nr:MAG: hypothetical protein H6797_01315 [Candidatus Nomurabacteria bacterium]